MQKETAFMASFYPRFVPGCSSVSTASVSEEKALPSKKRKYEAQPINARQDIKKSKRTNTCDGAQIIADIPDAGKSLSGPASNGSESLSLDIKKSDVRPILGHIENEISKPEALKAKEARKAQSAHHGVQSPGFSRRTEEPNQNGQGTGEVDEPDTGRERKKKRKKAKDLTETMIGDPETQQAHHTSIRSKFEKAKKKFVEKTTPAPPGHDTPPKPKDASPALELHGLEPLPQPPPVERREERPTFSTLPPWLANPLQVDSSQSIDFSSLALDPALLENVKKEGLEKAFSVQAAVIPLITDGPDRHSGDICISAATGSGKTLAYVLPMIQYLRKMAGTKLRGLIVVPTRELVRQAREICETFATGMNIRIATGVGSKSLNEEQEALVERYEIYDPQEYQRQKGALVDWNKFDLQETLSELDSEKEPAVGFVTRYRSKVDLMICTPGRLVDHIQSTKGFNLDDVQWVVIDEADRLLNESFQEWTGVVMPALQSRAARALQDRILRHMRLDVPDRIVQKIILSATLTQDISTLNSLNLRNPKLVVVGEVDKSLETEMMDGSAPDPSRDEGGTFNLPSTLAEYAVPVGDGSDKPLYLLELLRAKVNVFNLDDPTRTRAGSIEDESETSTSDSSASESESASTNSSTSRSSTSRPPGIRKTTSRSAREAPDSYATTALIFTRSTESANRLSRLLSLLSTPVSSVTATLTRSSASSATRKALTNFRRHKVRILIATDRASRGLDLPGLGHVISYDVPPNLTTYVHRVGRTARAGNRGDAWTLLAHREARWFWNEIGKGWGVSGRIIRTGKVQKFGLHLGAKDDEATRDRYERALQTLGEEVVGGGAGVKQGS